MDYGIKILGNNNIVSDNAISGGFYDVIFQRTASENTLINNNMMEDYEGIISIEDSSNHNTIKGNKVKTNIHLKDSSSNNFLMSNSIGDSIYIYENAKSNILYSNTIASVQSSTDISGSNQWDNGVDTGNHYLDYDEPGEGCADISPKNGRCDLPYHLGGSIDRYPITLSAPDIEIPEFPDVAIPVISVLGLLYIMRRKK